MVKIREGVKKKKKRWYTILAPPEFKSIPVGESLAVEPSDLKGRTLKLNLMHLTNDPKKQNFTLTLKVSHVSGDRCETHLTRYEMNKGQVKRISKKTTTKIEDSFLLHTKDNHTLRFKPLIMTRYKTHNSIATSIRQAIREYLAEYAKNNTAQDLFQAAISNKIQKDARQHIKTIYPIAISEIRVLTLT